jgi:membrane-bound lytic murein transglycosylase B
MMTTIRCLAWTILCCAITYFALSFAAHAQEPPLAAQEQTLAPIVVTAHRKVPKAVMTQMERFATHMSVDYGFDKADILDRLTFIQPAQDVLDFYRPRKKKSKKGAMTQDEINALKLLAQMRVNDGVKFWIENDATLNKIHEQYGIQPEVVVGLIGIETSFGQFLGRHTALEALTTLSFYGNHRVDYFKNELEQLFLVTRTMGWDIDTLKGSVAGAIGIPQFMPSHVQDQGIDFDGCGKPDIIQSKADAIASAAHFLVDAGWQRDGSIAEETKARNGKKTFVSWSLPGPKARVFKKLPNYFTIRHYNPSDNYVMSIFILGAKVKEVHDQMVASTVEVPSPEETPEVYKPVSDN